MTYEAVIGLEVHVQLKTQTKLFCGCRNEFGAEPNSHLCPVCLGLPGALPVPNEEAVIKTILTGLMLGSTIAPRAKFDRKNYFYPDMPKNYQISQYDQPLCQGGSLTLPSLSFPKDAQKEPQALANKKVRLVRIHLEEDVGKSFHLESRSGIDFNRAGTPLMEIVTEPDLTTPEEAFALLTTLREILRYGNVSDVDMEKGQLRCDVNISVRPAGARDFGTKREIKNLNSISAVRRALKYEIESQIELVSSGGTVVQQTMRWDDARGETIPMRTKEQAHDYRYFPDPDLLPIHTDGRLRTEAEGRMPELPEQKKNRLCRTYGLSEYQASVLASDPPLADYFESAARSTRNPITLANLILNDYLALRQEAPELATVSPEYFGELADLVSDSRLNSRQGREVLAILLRTPKSPKEIAEERGLAQISDRQALEAFCREAIAANPKSVADYKAGKAAAINALKGFVMKKSRGQANPQRIHELLEALLRER
ncbi:Aspartyl/glutamyl-tRNA(Asn/Gln) amidotransferase subunit B [Methylacidimicrobium cyclopophantes]|uniref:Aspartyl/glutamyl-tRNA(Asn/Gln) amidotransferase subunit B n=1 Tax=Methylacidimicrobium cyclopophantes TaxID=1041766 RepID=A0A5E6MBD0_9BACT|nr:Asp-tRNA(Asn)/Glu-tRNA(Gln) amidotransferase subunit GatB [Methylacidimicrobium cyclopophantes]VVM05629.1 Aspartyl/glutamyl-tRNA(Asn/Gln) amidotransferase subunit B [Methylacidimicrobium cyclopophantes]